MADEVRIERIESASAEALEIVNEYYEAVSVMVRDTPAKLEEIVRDPVGGFWLAWLGDAVVGCVVMCRLDDIAGAGECKRLYVRPAARGMKIADKLMDALEDHARDAGLAWVYLDTKDDLKAAHALYENRGYERCERYNDNPQATLFMRKRVGESAG